MYRFNLNLATPKDEYVMPIADMLVDAAANNGILSLMNGYSGYNQIFLAEEVVHKNAFVVGVQLTSLSGCLCHLA